MNLYQRLFNTVTIILVVLCHGFQSTSLSTPLSIILHDIKFSDLSRLDESTSLTVKDLLSTIGILKISGIPGLSQAQDEAFHSLSSCLLSSLSSSPSTTTSKEVENNEKNGNNITINDNQIFTTIMEDGTKRLTIGIKSSTPLDNKNKNLNNKNNMVHACGKPSSSLRALVDLGTRQLFLALDLALSLSSTSTTMDTYTGQPHDDITDVDKNQNKKYIADNNINDENNHYLMKPYRSFNELIDCGEHLEHLHAYYNTMSQDSSTVTSSSGNTINGNKPATMSMHTDAGLLIAMTSGYYSSTSSTLSSDKNNNEEEFTKDQTGSDKQQQQKQRQRGLFITLPNREIVHVDESDVSSNDLIIMVGAGGAEWLNPYFMSSTNNNNTDKRNNSYNTHHPSLQLRAVPHALVVELGSDTSATRNWYGKMILPPLDAELLYQSSSTTRPTTTIKDGAKNSGSTPMMTYKIYRDETLKKALLLSTSSISAKNNNNNDRGSNQMNEVPVACGESISSTSSALLSSSISSIPSSESSTAFSTLTVTVPVSCTVASSGEPGVMCWKQCMSATALTCGSGDAPMCTDTVTLKPVDGTTMCSSSGGMKACELACLPSSPSNTIITKPVISTFTPSTHPTTHSTQKPISNSYIVGNNNNNKNKSLFCLTPGTGTSMSMSGFIFSASDTGRQSECFVYLFPSLSLDTPFKFILGCLSTFLLGIGVHGLSKFKMSIPHYQTSVKMKFYLSISVYFVQIILSYIVMLIAMTYNVELFLMVCIGLTIGYALFHPHPYKDQHNNNDDNDSDDTSSNDTSTNTTNNSHNSINRYNHIKTTTDNDNDSEHGSVTSNSNMNSSLLASFMNSSSSSSSSTVAKRNNNQNNNNKNAHVITTHLKPCCQDLDYESLTPIVNNNKSNNNNHSKNNGGKKNDNEQLMAMSSNSSSKSDTAVANTNNIIKRRNF